MRGWLFLTACAAGATNRSIAELSTNGVNRPVERSLLATLDAANAGPLSAEGLERFFDHVLTLTRRELHGE